MTLQDALKLVVFCYTLILTVERDYDGGEQLASDLSSWT